MTDAAGADIALLEARIGKLTQALLHLAGEVWTARDRQAVLEHILADRNVVAPEVIDGYRPDLALANALEAQREALISNILGYLAPDR